jgi:hypothetical protein
VHTLLLCITAIINDATPRTRSFKHAGRCFRCAVKAVLLFFRPRRPVVDRFYYLFPVPCHPCLASCHMVRAEMSSLMIHTYVRAPASIPVPASVRTSRCIDTVRWSPYAIMPCHALPYTDCLSLPLLSSLQRDRVRAMWNLSYITLLYYSLGSALIRCRSSTHRHLE